MERGVDIKPIRTKYREIWFRSQLEAKWACLFDILGWKWEYEPITLNGYIPDFILPECPLLVEVKPAFSIGELQQYRLKITESGWTHDALIVGATVNLSGSNPSGPSYPAHAIGVLGEFGDTVFSWGEGVLAKSDSHWCLRHDFMCYGCRTGRDCSWKTCNYDIEGRLWGLWGEANNRVRWNWNREG